MSLIPGVFIKKYPRAKKNHGFMELFPFCVVLLNRTNNGWPWLEGANIRASRAGTQPEKHLTKEYRMNMFSEAFKRSLFSPNDQIDLGTRLLNAVGVKVASDPNGELMTNALKAALGNLVIATEREKSNPFTPQIHDKDNVRDNELCMIRDTIKTNTHNVKNGEVREAAQALSEVYNRHIGDIYRMGLAAESTAVKYLVESLMSEENKAKCELLGLVPLIEGLSQTQADLEALYAERTRLEPELEKYTLKNAMRETSNAIRAFLGFVDVLVTAKRDGAVELGDQVGRIIDDVEAIARSRRTRMQGKDGDKPEQPLSKAA